MNFFAKNVSISTVKTQCAVVFTTTKSLSSSASELDKLSDGLLSKTIKQGDVNKHTGSSSWLTLPASVAPNIDRLLLVQLGEENKGQEVTIEQYNEAFQSAANRVNQSPAKDCVLFIDNTDDIDAEPLAQFAAIAFEKAAYKYSTTKKLDSTSIPTSKVTLACHNPKTLKQLKLGVTKGAAIGEGINIARELGNLPGNICTPSYLAKEAKSLAKAPNVSVKVLSEKQMESLKMGSLLSVSKGSDEEGKLIIIEYKGKTTAKPHVLVGKGITFDTGGISLKPGAAMDEMKFDMCGAASVFGTLNALIKMRAKVHIVAIVAAAENMPSGRASKPGDVVTSMSGQTIEVLNTDAEGRLVLCDALTYAERFKPKSVVDIATLTGACVIALGSHATGLYSNNDELATALLESGKKMKDKAWQMPLWDEYQKQLDSNFADIANIGGREAGSVTAACFLSRFTKKYPWAHLDIAGTAWNSGANKGATGRPVALLVDYLLNN